MNAFGTFGTDNIQISYEHVESIETRYTDEKDTDGNSVVVLTINMVSGKQHTITVSKYESDDICTDFAWYRDYTIQRIWKYLKEEVASVLSTKNNN